MPKIFVSSIAKKEILKSNKQGKINRDKRRISINSDGKGNNQSIKFHETKNHRILDRKPFYRHHRTPCSPRPWPRHTTNPPPTIRTDNPMPIIHPQSINLINHPFFSSIRRTTTNNLLSTPGAAR
ncbi:hypothetical protein Droror1_Dr00015115 [Drosera rotundifolia]